MLGLAVHLLPRRRRGDGGRPRRARPHSGLQRAALRRRPPLELRRLRGARPAARLRPQRLRRDAARARGSGTSSGSPRASRSPAATRGFDARAARAVVLAAVARSTARRCAASPAMRNLEVWYARLDVDAISRAARATARRRGSSRRLEQARRQGARQGQPAGARQADRAGRRRAADRQRPAADRADRGAARRRATRGRRRGDAHGRCSTRYRRRLPRRPPAPARRATASSTCARKVVGVGSVGTRAWIVLLIGRDDERPAVPAGQGGAGLGARALRRRRASSTTTASGSSRASG